MAFGLDFNLYQNTNKLKGKQIDIACKCWFSCSGKSIPLMIKCQDADGEIQTIRDILVYNSEEQKYCGISTVLYNCAAIINERKYQLKIVFHKAECRWTMIIQ